MATATFSAPQAFIVMDGEVAGYMRNINFTENINRADVQGLGSETSIEVPVVKIQCSLSAGFYFIDFNSPVMKKILNRGTTVENFKQSLSLGNFPTQIVVYKKTIAVQDEATKLVTSIAKDGQKIVKVADFFIESQSFELSEGGIAGSNISGRYLTPITV